MASELKQGRLSVEEREYIRQYVHTQSVPEIAKHLQRRENAVINYIRAENLQDGLEDTSDEAVEYKLTSRADWTKITQQFDEEELEIVKDLWIKFYRQFNFDVLPSEELQLLEVIRLELLIHYNLIEKNKCKKLVEEMEEGYNKVRKMHLDKIASGEVDQDIYSQMMAMQLELTNAKSSVSVRTTEYEKLLTQKQRIYNDLKSTRNQRFSKLEDAKKNFVDWIKTLQDQEIREKEGKEMIMRLAAQKKNLEDLSKDLIYKDSTYDKPILNYETVDNE